MKTPLMALTGIALTFFSAATLSAHCDSHDGPVVLEARSAFAEGDVTNLLKWVSPEHEREMTTAFARAQEVARAGDPAATELAELWFLETLVRVHREGEGAPYTGLQPAGQIDPAVQLADDALKEGSAEALANRIGNAVTRSILERFETAAAQQPQANDDPTHGREFVEAYVEYVHFVEAVHNLITDGASHAH